MPVLLAACLCVGLGAAASPEPLADSSVVRSDAVVTLDENEFWVESKDRARFIKHRVVRIDNERGKKYGEVVIRENQYLRSRKISARIKDASGKILQELKEGEIQEAPGFPGYVLYSDQLVRWFDLAWNIFPYWIDYSYETEYKSLFFWPPWLPQEKIPVLKSTCKLVASDEIGYRTHPIGIGLPPTITERKGKKEIVWELTDLPPRPTEVSMPPESTIQTALLFSPVDFSLGSFKGSFVSWDAVAGWYRSLSAGCYGLSAETRDQVRRQLAGAKDDKEKVERLYRFLQAGTRYVAIELGIGGWQPHGAEAVFLTRQGDCKDLTTLLIAMLKEAGVAAYPALVLTRDEGELIRDFPSNQFNHLLTFVPLEKDTFWLDCTAHFLPALELPANVEGCSALVVKEDRGELLVTPQSRAERNFRKWNLEGKLSSSGVLQGVGLVAASGAAAHFLRESLSALKSHEQKEWLAAWLGQHVPGIDLQEFAFNRLDGELEQPLEIKLGCLVNQFGRESGSHMFVNPNVFSRVSSDEIPEEAKRRFPVCRGPAQRELDCVALDLPANLELEAAPDSTFLRFPFGAYRTSYSFANGKLVYQRELEFTLSQIPVDQFETYVRFLKTVMRNDQTSFVFVKK